MGGISRIARHRGRLVFTIANGTALSDAFDLEGYVVVGIVMPAAWTAASMTFQHTIDDGATWQDVYDDAGTEVTIASAAVVAGRTIVNKAVLEQLAALGKIRIRSGPTALPVNQAAARAITLVLKG